MIRKLLPPLLGLLFSLSSHAQSPLSLRSDTAQLREFRKEADAFNNQDPFANAYRAGRYNGYLIGVLDALQGKTVCFRECTCELDKLVEKYLAEHAESSEPVVAWLIPLLETKYPCK